MDKSKSSVTNKFIRYTGPVLSIVCFFIILIISEVLNTNYKSNLDVNLNSFENGWVLVEKEKEEQISFPFSLDYSIQECEIKNTFEEVCDDDILLLKYQYQVKEILVGGEVIYTFSLPSAGNISTTLGTNILSISMKKEYSNQEIKIVMNVTNPSKRLMIEDIYLGSRGDYLFSIYRENVLSLLVASILLITGSIYLIIYFTVKIKGVRLRSVKEEYFLSLFVFSFSTALWILTDLHLIFSITGHIVVNDILSYFSLSIVPIGLVYLVYYIIKRYRTLFIILEAIFCINVFLQTIFFTTGLFDLANMLIVTQILLIGGLLTSIIVVILAITKEKTREMVWLISGFGLFIILISVCIIGYLFGPIGFNYNLYFLLAMTILAFVFGYIILREFISVMGEHALMEKTIKYAYIDVLTNIGNRRAYEEAIVKEKTLENDQLAIIAFDVNYLKESNDTLGHKAGDELLIATANIIKNTFYENDGNNVFRTGGDEFSAIVHITREELLNKLDTLENEIHKWKGDLNITLSVASGYAIKEDYPEISLEELAIKADEEMYKNKRARHERVHQE